MLFNGRPDCLVGGIGDQYLDDSTFVAGFFYFEEIDARLPAVFNSPVPIFGELLRLSDYNLKPVIF